MRCEHCCGPHLSARAQFFHAPYLSHSSSDEQLTVFLLSSLYSAVTDIAKLKPKMQHSIAYACVILLRLLYYEPNSEQLTTLIVSWQVSKVKMHSLVNVVQLRPISMGGATDFKVGVQNRIRERSERTKFFCTPTFPNVGGTSKQISVEAYWIYWNLVSGCRINKHRQV